MQGIKKFLQGRIVILLIVLFFIIYPAFSGRYAQHIFIMIMLFALSAQAWNIVCGYVGEISLGHGVFLAIGGYVSSLFFVHAGLNPWIGMILGALSATLLGVLIGYPNFRLRGPYFTLTSIAFAEILRIWVENNETFFGINIGGASGVSLPLGETGLVFFDFMSKLPFYYIILGMVVIATLLVYYISTHKFGYYLVAIRSDPDAATSLGIDITKYKLFAMAVSAFVIAFAGTFYAQYFRYIGPTRLFGHQFSVEIALIGLVGGRGTVMGPLFGAVLLVPVSEWLSEQFGGSLPGLHLFIYGVVMVIVIFKSPQGINGYIFKFSELVEKKVLALFSKSNNRIGGGSGE